MTNKNYVHGRAFEQTLARKLRAEGWHVTRSAASKGLFDLIAIRGPHHGGWTDTISAITGATIQGHIKLIQCKTGASAKREIKKVEEGDIKKYEGLYSVTVEVM